MKWKVNTKTCPTKRLLLFTWRKKKQCPFLNKIWEKSMIFRTTTLKRRNTSKIVAKSSKTAEKRKTKESKEPISRKTSQIRRDTVPSTKWNKRSKYALKAQVLHPPTSDCSDRRKFGSWKKKASFWWANLRPNLRELTVAVIVPTDTASSIRHDPHDPDPPLQIINTNSHPTFTLRDFV